MIPHADPPLSPQIILRDLRASWKTPTMSKMIGRGVDGLLTDKPALARSVLEQRAQMSAPQRLLLELAGIFGVTPNIAEQ